MQKKEILLLIKNSLILRATKKSKKVDLEYIVLSPYIYGVIEGCKTTKHLYKSITLKYLCITWSQYKLCQESSVWEQENEVDIFLKVQMSIPEYKTNLNLWNHKMYYSVIHFRYFKKTKKNHRFFDKLCIEANSLNIKDIVIPLGYMQIYITDFIKNHNSLTVTDIIWNNLFLMMLSDFKDIVLFKRDKEYTYNTKTIHSFLRLLENNYNINIATLWELDFPQLIQENYEKFNKR